MEQDAEHFVAYRLRCEKLLEDWTDNPTIAESLNPRLWFDEQEAYKLGLLNA